MGASLRRFAKSLRVALVRYFFEAQCIVCEMKIEAFSPLCRWCFAFEKAPVILTDSQHRSTYVFCRKARKYWHQVKFQKEMFFLRSLKKHLLLDLTPFIAFEGYSVIPVPMHFSKYLERGFNQSEILARWWSQTFKIPLCAQGLVKVQDTVPQSTLSRKERETNLKNVFEWDTKVPLPEKVLLIDDVYTTGSTLAACKAVLKKVGVKEIYTWTLFQTPG